MVNNIPPTTAQVTIKYDGKAQTLKFNGNYGLKLGNHEYTVKDGHVYNNKGQPIKELKLNHTTAYQLLGMSNTAFEGGKKTYTFDSNDFMTLDTEATSKTNDMSTIQHNTQQRIGWGATDYHQDRKVDYKDGVFSSEYKSGPNTVSKVSIWKSK